MIAKPYIGTNDKIESLANEVRARVVKGEEEVSPGTLVRRLVKETGGEIVVVDDPSDQEVNGGSLVIRGKRDYTVYLSPYTTPLRDNFTIAHEIGHYVLHYFLSEQDLTPPLWFARYGSSPIEWQANRFAAAILMPRDEFAQAYQEHRGNLHLLSGKFDVSLPAVEVRAKSLGLQKG